jgi:hypothetical protein
MTKPTGAQGTYRRHLIVSCRSDAGHVDLLHSQAVQGAIGC